MSQSISLLNFAVLHDGIATAQRAWQRLNASFRAHRHELELEALTEHQARDMGLLEQYRDNQEPVSQRYDRISGLGSDALGVRAGPFG